MWVHSLPTAAAVYAQGLTGHQAASSEEPTSHSSLLSLVNTHRTHVLPGCWDSTPIRRPHPCAPALRRSRKERARCSLQLCALRNVKSLIGGTVRKFLGPDPRSSMALAFFVGVPLSRAHFTASSYLTVGRLLRKSCLGINQFTLRRATHAHPVGVPSIT